MPGDIQLTEKTKTANRHLFFRFSRKCKKEIRKERETPFGDASVSLCELPPLSPLIRISDFMLPRARYIIVNSQEMNKNQ